MRDYVPDEEFTLEDILREFGSGPDIPPPEPVLPGMPEAFPELPEVPEFSPKPFDAQQVSEEDRRRIRQKHQKKKNAASSAKLVSLHLWRRRRRILTRMILSHWKGKWRTMPSP